MKIIKAILVTIFLSTTLLSTPLPALAAQEDFIISSDIEVKYAYPDEYVEVSEKYTIDINNPDYFYRTGLEQTFFIPDYGSGRDKNAERAYKRNSIKVVDSSNIELSYKLLETADGIELRTNTSSMIDSDNTYSIIVTYKTHDLISLNGNISNVYIPGLPKNTKFIAKEGKFGLDVRYNFSATLITNKNIPEISHTQPKSIKISDTGSVYKFTVPTEDRLGKNSWIQIGTNQYYYFRIEQEAKQTDMVTPPVITDITDLASSNIYKIALPREYEETRQTTYIKSINPEPYKIERDIEGNIFALFKIPANADKKIVIEGYISQSKDSIKNQKQIPNTPLGEYMTSINDDPKLEKYLKAEKYWESNDPTIQKIAQELAAGTTTISELVRKDYEYVVEKFNYSYEKLAGDNIRLGAKAALAGGPTICMEYSDALTAILRAQGIPARIAIGYGNDPTGAENKISNIEPVSQEIAHQWTQVWIPNFGWLSVDPTWGESEREYIGSDLDHILWYAIGSFEEKIADTSVYTADNISSQNIGEYKIFLQALSEDAFSKVEGIQEASKLINKYENVETFDIDFTLRTSMLGRLLVYIIPALTAFTGVFILTIIIRVAIRKFREFSPNQVQ
ncbi:MAG TPA: transglutaminase-like domain-containing protein [Candidatus Dojkabacteria bacterium]|nr:transglutaminase-like domain-containing protein [Candidatus Dojkabacteria bacterium]